jgi:hypothetical protein
MKQIDHSLFGPSTPRNLGRREHALHRIPGRWTIRVSIGAALVLLAGASSGVRAAASTDAGPWLTSGMAVLLVFLLVCCLPMIMLMIGRMMGYGGNRTSQRNDVDHGSGADGPRRSLDSVTSRPFRPHGPIDLEFREWIDLWPYAVVMIVSRHGAFYHFLCPRAGASGRALASCGRLSSRSTLTI